MSKQEIQELLHESSLVKVQEYPSGKTAWRSIGFIFGFKLRQKLFTVNEVEMRVYISHLQSVWAAREGDRGNLAEAIARLCEMFVFKELKETNSRLAKLRQERSQGCFTYPVARCFGKALYRRVPDYDDISYF